MVGGRRGHRPLRVGAQFGSARGVSTCGGEGREEEEELQTPWMICYEEEQRTHERENGVGGKSSRVYWDRLGPADDTSEGCEGGYRTFISFFFLLVHFTAQTASRKYQFQEIMCPRRLSLKGELKFNIVIDNNLKDIYLIFK